MKRVHAAANLVEAHLLVHLLADRGIRARVLNANASSVAGELPIDQAMPQVWVDDAADAERARALIDEYARMPVGPVKKCPACCEENPSSFELCWSCGAGLEN